MDYEGGALNERAMIPMGLRCIQGHVLEAPRRHSRLVSLRFESLIVSQPRLDQRLHKVSTQSSQHRSFTDAGEHDSQDREGGALIPQPRSVFLVEDFPETDFQRDGT